MAKKHLTEEHLIEGLARAACETVSGGVATRWEDETAADQSIWIEEARGVLAYLRAHASEVCQLLGAAGPEEVEKAKVQIARLLELPDEGGWSARVLRKERGRAALAALGGKEQ